jgi:hypothetical protein
VVTPGSDVSTGSGSGVGVGSGVGGTASGVKKVKSQAVNPVVKKTNRLTIPIILQKLILPSDTGCRTLSRKRAGRSHFILDEPFSDHLVALAKSLMITLARTWKIRC